MKIFLVRHGKSDKSLQGTISHDEFELRRALLPGEEENARQLGKELKRHLSASPRYDLVFSGRRRSQQTVLAIAEGLGVPAETAAELLREDFGLAYLADATYWHDCEAAVKSGTYGSHAEFFLAHSPTGRTLSAQRMQQNMRAVLGRAIERNTFLHNDTVIMVSHEPVLSLCMSDLTGKTVSELGGSFAELEYAELTVERNDDFSKLEGILTFRAKAYQVSL